MKRFTEQRCDGVGFITTIKLTESKLPQSSKTNLFIKYMKRFDKK